MADDKRDDKSGGSRIIGRILPAAVQLWLRSQVENVEQLSIELEGRDRQIIRGYLPGVSVSARNAVYKGIYVGQVQLAAEEIRVNIGQVVRGKPLKLLNSFPVRGDVDLSDEDLSNSLKAPLLQDGLNSFWRSLLQILEFSREVENRYGAIAKHPDVVVHQPRVQLGQDCLALSFYPSVQSETAQLPVILGTGLSIHDGQFLQLNEPRWLTSIEIIDNAYEGTMIHSLQDFRWDLGKDTQLSRLVLAPAQLLCCGQVVVLP